MTELDMKKMSAAALFQKQSPLAQKEIRETYGDDLLAWMADHFKAQEARIKNRSAVLRKLGLNPDRLMKDMYSYLDRRLKHGTAEDGQRGTSIPVGLSGLQEEELCQLGENRVDGGEVQKRVEYSGDGEGI